ncbi:unnamed protein product, partial [Rotaria sordida]
MLRSLRWELIRNPTQYWSSMPSVLSGFVLGVLTGCLILAVILSLWLIPVIKTEVTTTSITTITISTTTITTSTSVTSTTT